MSGLTLRERFHVQLDPRAWPTRGLSPANIILVGAILLATASAIVGTVPTMVRKFAGTFSAIELGLGIVFAVEYIARLWSVVERRAPGVSPVVDRLRFVIRPSALLDLAIIVITLVPFFAINVMALRLVRLLRIFRLAKLGRMSSIPRLFYGVVSSRKYELVVTLGLASTLLIFGASAFYWIEGDAQPDKFGSIPRALWWAVITLTTIGYGDVYPITPAGKFVAGLVAISGIGLIAMPTGILAPAFSEATRKQ